MVVLFKEIKPSRLRVDALRLELLNAIRKVGRATRREFEATTKNWKHQVKFEMMISLKDGPTALVTTDDKIYGYVDEGTGKAAGHISYKYPIFAGIYTGKSKKKVLAFPSVSRPKTRPGSLKSGVGHRGKVDVAVPYVEHPGIKPRRFSKQIKKKMQPRFKREMERAMVRAAKKSGHGI